MVLKEAVVDRYPREDIIVATKLPIFSVSKPEDMEKYFNEQLEKCGVEGGINNPDLWNSIMLRKKEEEKDFYAVFKGILPDAKKHLGIL